MRLRILIFRRCRARDERHEDATAQQPSGENFHPQISFSKRRRESARIVCAGRIASDSRESATPNSALFEFPADEPVAALEPQPEPDRLERSLQASPVPLAGTQMNRAVRSRPVAVPAPVLG